MRIPFHSFCDEGYAARPGGDDLWALIEPPLPPWPQKAPGPQPVDDRLCPQGIPYVLYNDISWQLLPLELGFDPVRPAGADWAGGMRPVSSTGCTGACSPKRMRPTSWTGPGPQWMPPASARKRGRSNRPVAGRPREDGQQAPSDLRRQPPPTSTTSPRRWPWSTAFRPSPASRAGLAVGGVVRQRSRRLRPYAGSGVGPQCD
ncbi:transposase [Streptomyces pseudogriseolus]|uniref:transposase n=1 Tax=Streptomyces pseudogriseolus TaxID=36817 RepID=UPI003691496F